MKITLNWLQDWVSFGKSVESLAETLTNTGLEVANCKSAIPEFTNVIIGRVLKVEKHPNADRLHLCKVTIDGKEELQIVCGASNVYEDMHVAVANVGAVLSGNFKIKKTKIRDVESFGMMCSEKELGLAETCEGILDLDKAAPIGRDFREYLNANDTIIDIELTPNRGDCASHLGIAREVSTLIKKPLKTFKQKSIKLKIKDKLFVELKAKSACPRYVGRIIRNINAKAKTPLWMQERLRRVGLRSIHPVVDVTNYVMMDLGQPLHSFDLNKISKAIEVRFAKKGETLKLLNEETVKLNDKTLVIADKEKVLAIAGIMGGMNSEVDDETSDIFLESAFFAPNVIRGRGRDYGIQTDSSYRFERGVDPELQRLAIERVTELLLDICGGQPGVIVEVVNKKDLPKKPLISFRPERCERLLGVKVEDKELLDIFKRLNIRIVKKKKTQWLLEPPSYRFDLKIEVDLIEEIARVYGYSKIPTVNCHAELIMPSYPIAKISTNTIKQFFKNRDYHEIITYSFIDGKDQKLFDSEQKSIALTNPIAQDMSVMRTNLWPGLIRTLQYNLNRQQNRVRLFEIGLRFRQENKVVQEPVIAGLICGTSEAEQWSLPKRMVDFYDLKGDVEALLNLTHQKDAYSFKFSKHSALHPVQSAALIYQEKVVGYLGRVHPQPSQQLELPNVVFVFELLLNSIDQALKPQVKSVSKFPSIRRDLSIWVDETITVCDIERVIRKEAGNLLKQLAIFDLYKSQEKGSCQKSIALGMILQHSSRTMEEHEVNQLMTRVIETLGKEVNAQLRE